LLWLKNLLFGAVPTHEQRQAGRTQGHARKPQLETQQREVHRTGEDVGDQPSPLGHDGMALCVDQGTDRQEQIDHRALQHMRAHRLVLHSTGNTRAPAR